jgi:hypothetical protein
VKPLKAYEVSISFVSYKFTCTIGSDQLEDAVDKLCRRVLKLSDQEMAFFEMPSFLESVDELGLDDLTCYQVSKSRNFSLNVKRII